MRPGEPSRLQASINVTPLVDVVLVLLIIFMVVAPGMMKPGPEVDLPKTSAPPEQGDARDRLLVTIDAQGALWIDDQEVTPDRFADSLRLAAGGMQDTKVVIQGDASLRFGDVRHAMVAVEDAGFKDVGLIAQRAGQARRK
jgi:biopolymer transport protein TolR